MGKLAAVTGAGGFLGRWICKELLAQGYRVRCIGRNRQKLEALSFPSAEIFQINWDDGTSVKAAFKGADYVIHTAAMHPLRTMRNRDEILKFNVDGTRKVLENLDRPDRFIMISSMRALINKKSGGIFDENSRYDFEKWDIPYGYSKFLSEEICRQFQREKGLPLVIANPTPIIGPQDFGPSPNGRFILGFIKSPVVFTVKTNYSFVDARDAARAVVLLLKQGVIGENYLLCSANWPLRKFIAEVQAAAKVKKPVAELPLSLAYSAGCFFELLQNLRHDMVLPVSRSSVEFAALNPVFKGGKITKLGFTYTDPQVTIKESVHWLLDNLKDL